jgi:hypothetical protein
MTGCTLPHPLPYTYKNELHNHLPNTVRLDEQLIAPNIQVATQVYSPLSATFIDVISRLCVSSFLLILYFSLLVIEFVFLFHDIL